MRSSLACAISAIALLSCNYIDKQKSDKPRGSCEEITKDSYIGSRRKCSDAFTRERMRLCSGPNEKKSDTACVTAKAIAGCKRDDRTEWYFNDADGYATVESVGKYCVDIAKGTTVLPSGAAVAVKDEAGRDEDEAKKNLAEHGAKAKVNLATIASIATKLPAPTGKVDLQGLKGDALVVHREDLADPENPKKLDYRLENGKRLGECSRALNNRRQKRDAPYALSYCAKNPVLAVISVTNYTPAAASGSTVSGNTKTTYVKKGTLSGDVLLFRMDNGKYLGSFGFATESGGDYSPEKLNKELIERFPGVMFSRFQSAAPAISTTFDLAK